MKLKRLATKASLRAVISGHLDGSISLESVLKRPMAFMAAFGAVYLTIASISACFPQWHALTRCNTGMQMQARLSLHRAHEKHELQ